MEMPKKLLSMYSGQVCDFCPFNMMRIQTKFVYTLQHKKKVPTHTKCQANYERDENARVFVDMGDGKKQTFIKRPQACIDENGE